MVRREAKNEQLLELVTKLFDDAQARFRPSELRAMLRHSQWSNMNADTLQNYAAAATKKLGRLPLYRSLQRALQLSRPPLLSANPDAAAAWYSDWQESEGMPALMSADAFTSAAARWHQRRRRSSGVQVTQVYTHMIVEHVHAYV